MILYHGERGFVNPLCPIIFDNFIKLGRIYVIPLVFKCLVVGAVQFPLDSAICVVFEELGITGHLLGIKKLGLDESMDIVVGHFHLPYLSVPLGTIIV